MNICKQKDHEIVYDVDSETEEESDIESIDSDDSNDPTFDILEETRSGLLTLSIEKKLNNRICIDEDSSTVLDFDEIDVRVPELDEKDKKSFENVQESIQAGQLEKLKVDQCKVYLRKYGLRLTGNKDTLIQRIKEHIEVSNGGGERKYPARSFVLNCKGDACTGDVVMFEQHVYDMFSIVSRSASGPPLGTRLVVGRIVKESYGAAKQQHTFTIEVLWSKGERPHPPLHPLLIKGRNLYLLKTMRQRWEDEGERHRALMEKHSRGSLARTDRESRVQEKEMRKRLKTARLQRKEEVNKTQTRKNAMPHLKTVQSHYQGQTSRPVSHAVNTIWNSSGENVCSGNSGHATGEREFHHPSYRPPLTNMNYHYQPSDAIRGQQMHYSLNNQFQVHNQEPRQRNPCRFYAQGRCHFGDRCKFSHATRL